MPRKLIIWLTYAVGLLGSPSSAWSFNDSGVTIVKNGRTNYTIALCRDATERDQHAATELQKYLLLISGAELPILRGILAHGDSSIWIGSAGHSQGFPARIDWQNLEEDGFLLKTDESRIIIAGGTDKGSLYGVYTFLEAYLGCRRFSPTVDVMPKRATIAIRDMNDMQVPRIRFRMENFYEKDYADWHKLDTHTGEWGLFVHTFKQLVPPEKYFKDHPEYFTKARSGRVPDAQLCLANPDVFRIVVQGLRERMQQQPHAKYWSVSQNDTFNPCQCDACRAIDSVEGSPSGSLLTFVNRVADEFPDKIISTLAYQYSRTAPKYIKPRANVNIMLCSIECNRSKTLESDPTSASFVKDVHEWSNITKNILLWDYVIQFRNLISPFPNLRVLQPNIQFFAKNGITAVFEQGLGSMQGELAELRTYLIAKLLWNQEINVDSVTDDFLNGYYGPAAPSIRKYLRTMHDALEQSGEDLAIYGYPLPSQKGYLSAANIDAYHAIFDAAEQSAARNPELLRRVRVARLPLQFAILEQAKVHGPADRGFFHKTSVGAWTVRKEMVALLDTFVTRCEAAGIQRLEEMSMTPRQYHTSTMGYVTSSMKHHLASGKPVTLAVPASPKYHAGDEKALTNGLRGCEDYHMNWLGFEGEDMEATVDLGSVQPIRSIETHFLQDNNSWIFLPRQVGFSISDDGRIYRPLGRLATEIPAETPGAFVAPYRIEAVASVARFVRIKASNYKQCPDWHKGAGGLAWIFIDEIIIE